MPRLSEFYGIVIYMYFRDHNPPHFHAIYAEHKAVIRIDDGVLIEGKESSAAFSGHLTRTRFSQRYRSMPSQEPFAGRMEST